MHGKYSGKVRQGQREYHGVRDSQVTCKIHGLHLVQMSQVM